MNKRQEKFFNYIIERVQENKRQEAKDLLNESFVKQAAGTFNQEYLSDFASKMINMLNPEFIGEVKEIMGKYVK